MIGGYTRHDLCAAFASLSKAEASDPDACFARQRCDFCHHPFTAEAPADGGEPIVYLVNIHGRERGSYHDKLACADCVETARHARRKARSRPCSQCGSAMEDVSIHTHKCRACAAGERKARGAAPKPDKKEAASHV